MKSKHTPFTVEAIQQSYLEALESAQIKFIDDVRKCEGSFEELEYTEALLGLSADSTKH
jgi:hypothetical protein